MYFLVGLQPPWQKILPKHRRNRSNNFHPPKNSAWAINKPKNDAESSKYKQYVNKILIPIVLDAVATRTISLLTTNVRTWKLIRVSMDTMKKALNRAKNAGQAV